VADRVWTTDDDPDDPDSWPLIAEVIYGPGSLGDWEVRLDDENETIWIQDEDGEWSEI
jgi:hypothetical protein